MTGSPRFSSITTTLVLLAGLGLAASACGSGGKSGSDGSGSGSDSGSNSGSGSGSGGSSGTSSSSATGSDSASADSATSASASGDTTTSTSASTSGASDTTGTSSTGAGGAATTSDPLQLCGGPCQCSDGIDNDGDGQIDGFDTECTGASDNDEGSFATGIPGDNSDPKWQDCFFDGNSGAGDDGCRYSTDCLTGDLPLTDKNCTVSQDCIDFCGARTPNGCDCFGCCTVQSSDGPVDVYIVDTCDDKHLDDTDACPRCVKSDQCGNDCGECELCPGKDTLPDSCTDNTPTCDAGREPCDDQNPCADNYFCQFGCCAPPPTIN